MSKLLDHIKLREGTRYFAYLDSLGKLTGGTGHLITDNSYSEGDPITEEQVDEWLEEDISKAKQSAVLQMDVLGLEDEDFLNALISVNFQLGTHWHMIHRKTWLALRHKQYEKAIIEIESSRWNRQTPVRVADFKEAIECLMAPS